GLFELVTAFAPADVVVQGYPIQVIANNFVGTGRSALVELLQQVVSDNFIRRFERVVFSSNYCRHVVAAQRPAGAATVKLVGRVASVVGNQIKSVPEFTSVDFGNMPGPFVANVISGPAANHNATPAPDTGLNVTF